ncbi:MAG: hypothetical protein GY851_31345 [bacterium]|nr:hypothetical protein [bacterium]
MLSRLMTVKEQWVLLCVAAAIGVGATAVCVYHAADYRESARQAAETAQVEIVVRRDEAASLELGPDESVEIVGALDASAPDQELVDVEPIEPDPMPIQVSVVGGVQRPGVYQVTDKDRVNDLVKLAGGLTEHADIGDINLAAFLIDGTTLIVPELPGSKDEVPTIRTRPPSYARNPDQYTLSRGHLAAATNPGVPPTQARTASSAPSLIDLNRASSEELETLPGIGPKTATEIIRFRGTQPFRTVDDLMLVSGIGPKKLETVRALVTVSGY